MRWNSRGWVWAILAAVCLCPATLQAVQWLDEQRAGPFRCQAEFDLREFSKLIRDLTQLQDDLANHLAIEIKDDPIEVLLFRNRGSYQAYLANRVPEGMQRPALFIKGNDLGRVYAYYDRQELAINLRHECTHALLHSSLAVVPLWLDEGLAEYFEVPAAERAGRNPHLKSVRWALRFNWKPRLAALEAKRDMSQMGPKEYRDSWAWVHFMLHGSPEAKDVLVKYLTDIQEGTPPGSLGDNLRKKIPDVERRVIEHFRTWEAP
jgi:hypothetical protein